MEKLTILVSLALLFIGVESQMPIACTQQRECGENFQCISSRCVCPSTYYQNYLPNKCVPYAAAPGDSCLYNEQCKNLISVPSVRAICDKGYCICEPSAHYNGTKCYRNQRLTEECQFNEECSFNSPGSVCTGNICSCTFGFLPHPTNGSYCVRAAINPGDKCTDSNDCSIFMSTNSFCENNTCTCRAGYHFAKQIGKCLVNKRLGDSCTTAEECYFEADGNEQHVDCISNQCSCLSGFRPSGDNTRCNDASSLVPLILLIVTSLFSLQL